jgi:hypothetical protein
LSRRISEASPRKTAPTIGPADQIEQRGLAGAVRADQGDDLALAHAEADPIENPQAAEALANVRAFEENRPHGFPL